MMFPLASVRVPKWSVCPLADDNGCPEGDVNKQSVNAMDWGPLIRMIPIAPPAGVEGAQMVSCMDIVSIYFYLLDFIKDDADEIVNLIFIASVGLESAAIGYHHTDGHGAMAEEG